MSLRGTEPRSSLIFIERPGPVSVPVMARQAWATDHMEHTHKNTASLQTSVDTSSTALAKRSMNSLETS